MSAAHRQPASPAIASALSATIGRAVAGHLASQSRTVHVDEMTVHVVRRPTPQSSPRLALHVHGRLDGTGDAESVDAFYVVVRSGDSFVVEAVFTAPP